jgi:hypothetical protein
MVTEDDAVAAETTSNGDARLDMRALARQILRVEGLTVEDRAEDEVPIPDDDAPPRDLQSHSTYDSRPAGCV